MEAAVDALQCALGWAALGAAAWHVASFARDQASGRPAGYSGQTALAAALAAAWLACRALSGC